MGSFIRATKASCVILSAGRSERMNAPKAFLKFSDKENFLQRIIHVYHKAGIKDIIIVLSPQIESDINKQDYEGVRFVVNPKPERGRMSSLKTGLQLVENGYVLIQNVDSPFVTVDCIKLLLEAGTSADYIVPVYRGDGGHPVLLSNNVVKHIIDMESDDFKLNEMLKTFNRAVIEVNDEGVLVNINTPVDYEKYFLNGEVNFD
jgi:molybdenum cofactor cytidylyltransferase